MGLLREKASHIAIGLGIENFKDYNGQMDVIMHELLCIKLL